MIAVVSSYAIVQSIQLLFGVGQSKKRENEHIKKLVKRSLRASKIIRANRNNFFVDLENSLYVTHRLFTSKRDKRYLKKHYPIRIRKSGIVRSINVKRLDEIITREYYNRAPQTTKKQSTSMVFPRSRHNPDLFTCPNQGTNGIKNICQGESQNSHTCLGPAS